MFIPDRIAHFHRDMISWRHDIHAHPELAFREHRTSDFVATKLTAFGIPIHRGLAGTGIVGTLRCGSGDRAIALRADMDALPIQEKTGAAHASTHNGVMHACGHDGHTTMLLGAARYLTETRNFDGVVHFVFQPAEENECGGQVMVEAGLFTHFPVDEVYGMHNWPGLPVGAFAVRSGPMMAADDKFEITLSSRGAHAAMPHLGDDPIVAVGTLIGAIQTIASRIIDPQEDIVVSVTEIHGGNTWNVIPEEVVLRGTCRYFNPELRPVLEAALRQISGGVAATHGVKVTLRHHKPIPPAVNAEEPTEKAARAAALVVGEANVHRNLPPSLGCEDFAFMLAEKPGCYIWIGNGPMEEGRTLHGARYDFKDEILPIGASYWCALVESVLPRR
ncbi:MAG: M20 aminoacylase family protein [Gemmatimonadota bacterium]